MNGHKSRGQVAKVGPRMTLNDFWFTYLNPWSDVVKFYSLLKGIGRAFALSYLPRILLTIWLNSQEVLESLTHLKIASWARFHIHFLLVSELDWLRLGPDLTRHLLILFLLLSHCYLEFLHCRSNYRSHFLLALLLLLQVPPLFFLLLQNHQVSRKFLEDGLSLYAKSLNLYCYCYHLQHRL